VHVRPCYNFQCAMQVPRNLSYSMFGGILMEWAEEAARLSVHRHLHAMFQGEGSQNLKTLVRKFERLGQESSSAAPRWFHLSTV
jgi:hypothetical protein